MERIQNHVRSRARSFEKSPTLRPVDGFVLGGDIAWDSAQNLWVLFSRPDERLIDFFLEDAEFQCSPDPVPCACAGVLPDGTLLVGAVDWKFDRFLSELLDAQESPAPRPAGADADVRRRATPGGSAQESRWRGTTRR